MRRLAILLPISTYALLVGCGGSFELSRTAGAPHSLGAPVAPITPRDDVRCQQIDSLRRRYNACALVALSLSAGSGIASIPVPAEGRPYVIAGSVLAATAAGVCRFLSDDYSNLWAKDCAQP